MIEYIVDYICTFISSCFNHFPLILPHKVPILTISFINYAYLKSLSVNTNENRELFNFNLLYNLH